MVRVIIGIIFGFLLIINSYAGTVYGPTTAKDNLWKIANKFDLEEIDLSVYQVMLAIFCFNKDAFYRENINALDTGKTLKIPATDIINKMPKERAYLEVEKQNHEWVKNIKYKKHKI
jgi:FimV-like protein